MMAIIPTVRCSRIEASIAFYTTILDFEHVDGEDTTMRGTARSDRRSW